MQPWVKLTIFGGVVQDSRLVDWVTKLFVVIGKPLFIHHIEEILTFVAITWHHYINLTVWMSIFDSSDQLC